MRKGDWKLTLKLEYQSHVFEKIHNKLCTMTSNVLTVTDKNHKCWMFPILQVDVLQYESFSVYFSWIFQYYTFNCFHCIETKSPIKFCIWGAVMFSLYSCQGACLVEDSMTILPSPYISPTKTYKKIVYAIHVSILNKRPKGHIAYLRNFSHNEQAWAELWLYMYRHIG